MRTYKLCRIRGGKLYPLYVEANRETVMGEWLKARIGELYDETHVKSKLGPLSLRPGYHSCSVPFTDWIGKKEGNILVQRKDSVWCECDVEGNELTVTDRYGLRTIPNGWYYFRTRPKQPFPWIISDRIYIRRRLTHDEVEKICLEHGVHAQKMEE